MLLAPPAVFNSYHTQMSWRVWMNCGKYCFNYVVVENRAWSRGLGWQAHFFSPIPPSFIAPFLLVCHHLPLVSDVVSEMDWTFHMSVLCWFRNVWVTFELKSQSNADLKEEGWISKVRCETKFSALFITSYTQSKIEWASVGWLSWFEWISSKITVYAKLS